MILPADPKRSYLAHKEEIDAAVHRVLDSGWYILGAEASAFEKEFAAYVGVAHGIGVGSGTEALHVALRACGVGPGDMVATVSHTAVATVAAIELTGAAPVLVDVDPRTFTMDPANLEAAFGTFGSRIKAVVVVHLYGHPADMPAIQKIAGRHGASLIEDCAQAHGAKLSDRSCGTWGRVAAFSFYPTKNLGALGDGGAVVTNDPALNEKCQLLRQYGWRTRYISETAGFNTRLDELQAAILRVKLPYLDRDNERRRAIARRYDAAFAATPLVLPVELGSAMSVYHQYTVRTDRRDALQQALKDAGVGAAILYPEPVHLQAAYRNRVQTSGNLEQTERLCRDILCLPMHAYLDDEEVERVIDATARFFR